MANKAYLRAVSRLDHSHYVLHLTRDRWSLESGTATMTPAKKALYEIINSGLIKASTCTAITHYAPEGAVCFYDVPYQFWPSLVETNPSGRRGYGILVWKQMLWGLGGRPAIYTEDCSADVWPEKERFRLIATNLTRADKPLDWTHEHEWRLPKALDLRQPGALWWWACVSTQEDAIEFFQYFPQDHPLYVLSMGRAVGRQEFQL